MYDLDIDRVINFAREKGLKRVLLQFANGLKQYSQLVLEEFSQRLPNVEVVISGSSCYGACDVAFEEALKVGADGIVHYGHTPFPESYSYAKKLGVEVLFVEGFSRLKVDRALERALDILSSMNVNDVGITAALQEIPHIPLIRRSLEKEGYRVHVGMGSDRVKYAGQVLGCDYTAATTIEKSVEAYLHVGGGLFHAIGLSLIIQKPVILCDPYRGDAKVIDHESRRVKAARLQSVVEAIERARSYCIVVGCKWRQRHIHSALKIKKKFDEKGMKTVVVSLYDVTPHHLDNFAEPDAFVITACPRIPIDDYMSYKRPVLTVLEALIVVGELALKEWTLCDWTINEKATRYPPLKD